MITMTKYSNNYIVNDVARNYQIKGLITRMIDYSSKDKSNDDLTQYIYEYLLNYDNNKLNQMYQSGINTKNPNKQSTKLRNFISQIILNARSGGVNGTSHPYQKELRLKERGDYWFEWHDDLADNETYDPTADIIIEYINIKANMIDGKEYSSDQLKTILSFTLLKKYFLSDLTQVELAKHLGLSRLTIGKLLKSAREDVKIYWLKIGQFL